MSSTSWESIVVAVRDPGARRQIAIRKAAGIAARCGARVTLFHAFSTPTPVPEVASADASEILKIVTRQRREQLLKLARPLRAQGIEVKCDVVWDFPAAHAIVREVLKSKPDLVVAESHRHSRVARWFLANSDWDLIRECPCPVWFVKHERLSKRSVILTAVDPTHAHAKPSGLDDRLLQAAKSVKGLLGGRLALAHVMDSARFEPARLLGIRAHAQGQKEDPGVTATMDALGRLAKRYEIAEADRLLRTGVPAEELISSAAECHADLLVMGAVSRSGLSHIHIGSTAEAVIDGVACDVLIVKPRQFKTTVPRKGPKLADGRR